ncbi:MAG TPA: tetratricopeptide repeat protein [Bacteroidia bacterium]|jgi:Tol biopolymer transport system component
MNRPLTKTSLLLFLFLLVGFSGFGQSKDQNVIGETGDQVKLFNARQSYFKGDYVKALNLYKEVLKNKPNDANVLFHVGEVYFAMDAYDDAQEYLEKAYGIDPKGADELLYYLARVHHVQGDVDKAKTEYEQYKTQLNNEAKAKELELDLLIQQCVTAKDLMSHPVDVVITNAGDMINSSYDDKGPSITADGKTLVFTSRRPQGKSGQNVDKEGDYKYFDDIYTATWDETKQNWTEADLIKGSVNTEDHDAVTSISPDGKQIFIYRNNNTDARGGEIFVSKVQQSGKWGAPKNIGKPISTSYVELGACISSDGQRLFFVSERPKGGTSDQKGFGQGDIWMSTRISKTQWGPPVNLGPDINTPMDEGGIFLDPDGKTLFFSSDGHNTMGGYDVFMTRFENGKWSKPVNLGYPINSTRDDKCFVLSTDNKTAYFDSNRSGGTGDRDIYKVDMSKYHIMGDENPDTGPKVSILKGTVIISESGQGTETTVIIKDKETGQEVSRTTSSPEGEYFFTLPADKKYIIEVDEKGYQKVSEEFTLPSDKKGTFTMVKHLLLNKEKK